MTMRMEYEAAAPAAIKARGGVYGAVAQSGLPKVLVDLVYLRVSQINGCAYCIDMHGRELADQGISREKLMLVPVWREAGALFEPKALADLTVAIGLMNAYNRLAISFRRTPAAASEAGPA